MEENNNISYLEIIGRYIRFIQVRLNNHVLLPISKYKKYEEILFYFCNVPIVLGYFTKYGGTEVRGYRYLPPHPMWQPTNT